MLRTCYAITANVVVLCIQYFSPRFTLTSNQVRLRGAFFGVSAVVLAIMWVIYIVEILTSPWV